MIFRTSLYFFCLAFAVGLSAQPIPAPPQSEPIAVIGATIHTAEGRVIPDGVILFEDGRITAVDSRSRNTVWEQDRYKQIFAEGKHVYPGLIALNSQLGLVEIESIRPTRDYSETGSDNLNVRALIAYNTDSRVLPTVRSNGVLQAQITPTGGRWSGLSSVVQLDAWNWEDAAVAADEGLHLHWPAPYSTSGWWAEPGETNRNKAYQEEIDKLDRFVKEARGYCSLSSHEEQNLRFKAMCPVFAGERKLYVHAQYANAIMDAVRWARSHGIRPVIMGGRDAWQIIPFLKEQDVPVVLIDTQRLPGTMDEDIDQPFRTPGMLHQAGIPFAITVSGFWQQRNLSYNAGQVVPYGLDKEAALQTITLSPARILGIDDRTGSLRVGKEATLIITDGDILDMRSSRVIQAFIQGREIILDDHHQQLYRRFQTRYGESGY
jgi:imidazolonepropionase-like amidohydrolase